MNLPQIKMRDTPAVRPRNCKHSTANMYHTTKLPTYSPSNPETRPAIEHSAHPRSRTRLYTKKNLHQIKMRDTPAVRPRNCKHNTANMYHTTKLPTYSPSNLGARPAIEHSARHRGRARELDEAVEIHQRRGPGTESETLQNAPCLEGNVSSPSNPGARSAIEHNARHRRRAMRSHILSYILSIEPYKACTLSQNGYGK